LDNQQQTLSSVTNFSQYGHHFQKCVMTALLVDRSWAAQMSEVLKPAHFELKYLEFLSTRYLAYTEKYKDYPSLKLLVSIVRDELKMGNDLQLRDQIVDFIKEVNANSFAGDLPHVKEKSLDFCKKQNLKRALEKTVDDIAMENYDSIVETIKKALSAGTAADTGHDFFEDTEARFQSIVRNVIPTGFPELDAKDIFQGGIGQGELGSIVASTGAGKSHCLTALGANALRLGYNVVYYTFELSAPKIGIRFDSNFCDIDSNDIVERKEEVLRFYENNKFGKLIIKSYPANTATVGTLRAHMEKLSVKDFRPDLVIIDYADIMRSSRQYDSPRHELKLLYEELRSLADELHVPIWTASQSNREGANSEIIDVTNMSESYGKAATADIVLSISRRAHEKASGMARLFIAKNRAGRDGLVFPIKMNTARSQFEFVGSAVTPGEAQAENETDAKQRLKNKFAQYEDIGLKKLA